MNVITTIDKDVYERVEIYSHENTSLVRQIEDLVYSYGISINGYSGNDIVPLPVKSIYRIYVEANKVYASTIDSKYHLKLRLYQIEEIAGESFIKINQSALVNKEHIKSFAYSWGGALTVKLTNGEEDYISRRQTKIVMERMGIK